MAPSSILLPGKSHGWRSLVGWSDFTFTFHFHALKRKRQPTPVFLPGKSQGWGRIVGCRLWGCTELYTTEAQFSLLLCRLSSVQSLSRVRLCDPMGCSTPGLPVHHQLPEFTQTHVHRVGDAIQPSHLLSSPSPPALNLSQHQGLFQ